VTAHAAPKFASGNPGILAAALDYAKRRKPVFPCHGKTPMTKHGFHDASADEKQIRAWWAKWPSANIGIPTGAPSRLLVVDIDGSPGEESLKALEIKYGMLPRTRTIITSPGHLQLWFTQPENVTTKSSASVLGKGLDMRGDGGYVVAPPSIHPTAKKPYLVLREVGPLPAPAWLIELVRRGSVKSSSAKEVPDSIPAGQRNTTLTSLAGTLRRRGMSEAEILDHLRLFNSKRCNPPLPDDELRAIAASIGKKPTVVPQESRPAIIVDMPEAVLDGRLGELCERSMGDCLRAYAWPSLLVCAGTLVAGERTLPTNLFVALVGPVGSGKTQAAERAMRSFGMNQENDAPPILKLKAGSGEGLLKEIGDLAGAARLYRVDELGHLLEKAHLENSSFPHILNSLFYSTRQKLRIARGEQVNFNCSLSILGGLLDESFGDLFGKSTTSGLYDRFVFGQWPTGASFLWRPFEGQPLLSEPAAISVHPEVWEARDSWVKILPGVTGRIAEIALRAAAICAAFDGKKILMASDLAPARAFAEYQARIRTLLRPNPGENFEARAAFKFLAYLQRHAPEGQWVSKRQMLKDTRAYELGPSVCDRALGILVYNGDLEEFKDGRKSFLRFVDAANCLQGGQ
jgi:Bifunctional DNA primase/polymerase, N-terminal/Primase C terminal 1 (PriCT-1)